MRFRALDIDDYDYDYKELLTKMTTDEAAKLIDMLVNRLNDANYIISRYEELITDYKYVIKYNEFRHRLAETSSMLSLTLSKLDGNNQKDAKFVEELIDKYCEED